MNLPRAKRNWKILAAGVVTAGLALGIAGYRSKVEASPQTNRAGATNLMSGMKMSIPGMNMSGATTRTGSGMKLPNRSAKRAASGSGVPNRVPVDLDREQTQFIDIRTEPVRSSDAVMTIRTVGIIAYDQARLVNVNTRIMGWAQKLYVDKPGQFVKKGDPLMDIYSPDLYSAQYEYLLAYRQYWQLQQVRPRDRSQTNNAEWRDSVREARALMDSARKRLRLWQVPADEITALEKSGQPSDTLQLHAPFSGYVIQKSIDPAQMVRPGMTLYRVANLNRVWINTEIYEYELPYVKVGQDVTVTAPAYPDRVFHAKVDFIYPYSENKTRTTTARLVMDNHAGLFKPDDYVNGVIQVDAGQHLLIPSSAVYDTGVSQYVFVEASKGHFVPRPIQPGPHVEGGQVVVNAGLTKGQPIVVDGNFLLDSESQLQAASAGGRG